MNGTGAKGGAYGFKISSINKLVDTKSVNNTTLLHFVERTVSSHFPEMESFLEELAKPAEAYRVNLQDTRKGTTELREGLKTLRDELQEHFADVDSAAPYDLFGKKMWRFVGEAKERLDDLLDEVRLADSTFIEVVKYYGEDEKNMTSTEFFGIFKTFVTSYQKCKNENRTAAEERAAAERRRQQVEEAKAARAKADTSQVGPEDTQMLDSLIEKLRAGDSVKGRATRKRNAKDRSARPAPSPLSLALLTEGGGDGPSGDAGDLARGMLAALKSDGFAPENMDAIVPIPMSSSTTPMSPTRRRARIKSDPLLAEELENLTRESELNTPPIMDGYPSPTDQDQPGELRDKE
ncbi:actin-binding FH2 [Serendipita vermifera]|nr:actin-binding FH2 [Serendipita vermifera]